MRGKRATRDYFSQPAEWIVKADRKRKGRRAMKEKAKKRRGKR